MAIPLLPTAILAFGLFGTATSRDCGVGGATLSADAARAHRACDTARARFTELFGASAPAVHIVLRDDPGYEVASSGDVGIVFWPRTSALVPAGMTASREWVDRQWTEVLPHEIMHALTMASFYAESDAVGHGGYGTPLPDWFEEGIAIWAEPAESRNGRLEQARNLPAHHRDLPAILRTPHPAAAAPDIIAARPGAIVPPNDALRMFYPQSIAVVLFVFDAGGAPALHELARRLVRAPADYAALLGLPGLPAGEAELLASWGRWLTRETP